jgi:hypothetical protein
MVLSLLGYFLGMIAVFTAAVGMMLGLSNISPPDFPCCGPISLEIDSRSHSTPRPIRRAGSHSPLPPFAGTLAN